MPDLGAVVAVGLLGVATGLQYALLAVGLVLVYKAGRFVNVAQSQLGVVGAALLARLAGEGDWPYWPTFFLALAVSAAIAVAIERTVVQRLFGAPRLVLLLATIGVAQLLLVLTITGPLAVDGGALAAAGGYPVPFTLDINVGSLVLTSSQLVTLVLAPLLAFGLGAFFRTTTGKAVLASSSNPDAARLAGISVRRVSLVVWIVAGVLSGLTAILLAPSQPVGGLNLGALGPSILLRGLAAGLIGAFVNIPLAFGAGVLLGVVEQAVVWNVTSGGAADVTVLVVVVVATLVRGRTLARSARQGDDRVGDDEVVVRPPRSAPLLVRHIGRVGWAGLIGTLVALPLIPALATHEKATLLTFIVAFAMVALSLTVLTGWTGQPSLGHFALLGVGAYAAARAHSHGWAVPAELLLAGLAAAGVAVLVGLPALRFRGLSLAVSTLAFALAAPAWLFRRPWISDGSTGNAVYATPSNPLRLPCAHIGDTAVVPCMEITTTRGVYVLAVVVLVACLVALQLLRRSNIGRAFVAVRDNEAAAAAHGIAPAAVKVLALAVSGFLAGMAGAVWGMAQSSWSFQAFDATQSIVMLSIAVVGGIGTLHGPVLGTLAVFAWPFLLPNQNTVVVRSFCSGALLLVVLLFAPGGLAGLVARLRARIVGATSGDGRAVDAVEAVPEVAQVDEVAAPVPLPATAAKASPPSDAWPLVVENVSVRFGGIAALDHVSITVGPGEIVGLIGGNGAGKSTLLNCVSGHQPVNEGSVQLFGEDVTRMPPEYRPYVGMARTFQDARLFSGLTVEEVALLGLDRRRRVGVLSAAVGAPWSRLAEREKREAVGPILRRFGLEDYRHARTNSLSTGMRRLCDLATMLSEEPALVLLDEPTAGVAQREVEAVGPLLRGLRDELGCSMLVIEHDLPLLLGMCDRVYALESGTVIAEGPPEEVRQNPRVVAGYLGTTSVAVERSGGGAPEAILSQAGGT